jgi:hydrogenase nickel incorporation protein HypA/HybF
MHELSIAMSIVDLVEEEAAERGGAAINAIHLRLGALAGVVKDALLFSWDVACEGTSVAGSRLVIEEVPILMYCPACRGPRKPESMQWLVCPECRSPVSEVLQGRELQVVAMEIAE